MFCFYDGRMLTPWLKGMQVLRPPSKVPVQERCSLTDIIEV